MAQVKIVTLDNLSTFWKGADGKGGVREEIANAKADVATDLQEHILDFNQAVGRIGTVESKITGLQTSDSQLNNQINQVRQKVDALGSVLTFQGVLSSQGDLSKLDEPKIGDVYHIQNTGAEFVYAGMGNGGWIELGTVVDLSGYYSKTEADQKFQLKGIYVTAAQLKDYVLTADLKPLTNAEIDALFAL